MFNTSHVLWSNDVLVLTVIIVLIGASIALDLASVHGWSR